MTPSVPGSMPVAVCWRISRIRASSRVAMSTFAEASRAVSWDLEAVMRNAATVTTNARPMTRDQHDQRSRLVHFFSAENLYQSLLDPFRVATKSPVVALNVDVALFSWPPANSQVGVAENTPLLSARKK